MTALDITWLCGVATRGYEKMKYSVLASGGLDTTFPTECMICADGYDLGFRAGLICLLEGLAICLMLFRYLKLFRGLLYSRPCSTALV